MEMRTYWVGDRPGGSETWQVLNERLGVPEVLVGYTTARMLFIDSDNKITVFEDPWCTITNAGQGLVTFLWPDESLFTKSGRYIMQLELEGPGTTRKTTVQDILVKRAGGVLR